MKPSKWVPHISFRVCLVGFHIGSIETRHGTSLKPSSSLGEDKFESRYIIPPGTWGSPGGRHETVKWVPHMRFRVIPCWLCHFGSIETRHGTSLKPSSSLGDDDVASSFILLVVPIQLGGGTVPRKTIVDLETTINLWFRCPTGKEM